MGKDGAAPPDMQRCISAALRCLGLVYKGQTLHHRCRDACMPSRSTPHFQGSFAPSHFQEVPGSKGMSSADIRNGSSKPWQVS